MITVASFGGGTDSTAMIIGWLQRQLPLHLILFADTGDEKPHTYDHIKTMNGWLLKTTLPQIITVRYKRETLSENCFRMKMLPSIAYGYKGCSQKYKIQPQDQYCNNWEPAKAEWKEGRKVVKLIGYEAGEERRAKIAEDDKYTYRYPLIEWGWDRAKCEQVIKEEFPDLPPVGKSACYHCPSSKPAEVVWLAKNHPDLFARAVAMERNANLTTIKGLGRDYSWEEMVKFKDAQLELLDQDWSTAEVPCGCYDG